MYEEDPNWSETISKLASKATREAFEMHKKAGHRPVILVGNELRRIWADDSYEVIKNY